MHQVEVRKKRQSSPIFRT